MALPATKLPEGKVKLASGDEVALRGLSRGEALAIADLGDDAREIEVTLLHYAAGVEMEKARDWHNTAPSADVQVIVEAVLRLSGLDADGPKGSSEG